VEPHYFVREESVIVPSAEEKDLLKEYNEARRYGEKEKMLRKRDALVHLYVYYGDYFNSAIPTLVLSEDYLQKALALNENHSLANYRIAHIHYKNRKYLEALNSFKKSLIGSEIEKLNETQEMLAQMFIVNCGVLIAKEARKEIESIKINASVHYDEKLVNRYRNEIFVSSEKMIDRMIYCKITPQQKEIISEDIYSSIMEMEEIDRILLSISDQGYEVKFHGQKVALDIPSFYIFYTLLKSNQFITGEDIRKQLFDKYLEQSISDSSLHKTFNKLKERLSFWDQIIETTTVGSKTARRLKSRFSYCVLYRASDILPELKAKG
jgi:tetratricopeptide (TPR) repeat protein